MDIAGLLPPLGLTCFVGFAVRRRWAGLTISPSAGPVLDDGIPAGIALFPASGLFVSHWV